MLARDAESVWSTKTARQITGGIFVQPYVRTSIRKNGCNRDAPKQRAIVALFVVTALRLLHRIAVCRVTLNSERLVGQ